jgi:hypothetical protein
MNIFLLVCPVCDSCETIFIRSWRGNEEMTDEELLLQAANVPTVFVDGFGGYRKINGVLRCIGYVIGSGAQFNLVMSLAGAEATNRMTREALDEKPTKGIRIWERAGLAH